ncbi:EI24 domain-containing protein [Sulfurovum mangrovi]|uniref:EI24 domain-containing protein n=1 Tax=Sulfurovum mangrovi TaxID=2893889 RepID=UPI001E58D994|nr:EI24 domain-containing protein [Sulfurovum mangrovi]UFH59002.1 EI24 domain-containing protein [Sulfurovum mangrovi]
MQRIVTKSLRDIFSPSVVTFVVKIALLSLLSTFILSWIAWDPLFGLITLYAGWIPWEWLTATITSLASLLIAYTLFIIMVSLFTALMSEKLLITLAKKHYPSIPVTGSADITTSVLITLKSSAVFIGLFILLLPLLFIPILGQVVILYLWSILLKDPTVYDVGSLFISDKEVLKAKSKKSTLIAMIGSLFNYLPLLNLFAPVFAQILFLHHILKDK